jgi:hypothetical protein
LKFEKPRFEGGDNDRSQAQCCNPSSVVVFLEARFRFVFYESDPPNVITYYNAIAALEIHELYAQMNAAISTPRYNRYCPDTLARS